MAKKSTNKKKICKLTCPKCYCTWAELSYQHDNIVKSTDVRVLEGKPFNDGDELACRKCGYLYSSWDIWMAIANANKKVKNEKA